MRSRLLALSASALLLTVLAACGGSDPSDSAAPKSGGCEYVKGGEAAKQATLPPAKPLDVTSLTIATNRGDIKATLTPKSAPCAVNSFASLAKQGYFDGTKCHRLVVDFVLQCGDPSGSGRGGPGYSFADEVTGKETYPPGTLAMANSGPDTNGSQFFIVLDGSGLTPDYTVFGSVDAAGLKVVKDIAAKGNGADGVAPAEDVIITSVK